MMQLKLTVINSANISFSHDGKTADAIEIPKKILEDEFSESSKNKNTTKKKAKGVQGELATDTCTYKGEVLDGRAEGYGNLTYISGPKSGDTYEGEFENNMFNGHGKYIFKDGGGKYTYTGEFIDGSMTGKGRMTFKNDDIAEGMFVNGKCNGQGKVWKYSGDIYEGGLRNNFYHGRGKLTYKAGGYYDGDWNDGFATGHGTKLFQSTDLYTGQMKNGKPHGHGECTYKNGNRYIGMWHENTLTGEGTLHYKNGDVYTGQWNRNKRVRGHVKFRDGGEHWATYENEKITGAYKRKYPNGTILEGPVVNGKVNGNGSYLFTSGTRWEGHFVNDLLQGEGVKIVNGVRKRVMFKDNKIERDL